jgi:hypothetical protein
VIAKAVYLCSRRVRPRRAVHHSITEGHPEHHLLPQRTGLQANNENQFHLRPRDLLIATLVFRSYLARPFVNIHSCLHSKLVTPPIDYTCTSDGYTSNGLHLHAHEGILLHPTEITRVGQGLRTALSGEAIPRSSSHGRMATGWGRP